MKTFLSGLITAGDGNASMAKTMTWIVFAVALVSWFFFPEKSIGELLTMFGLLLGYALGGKASFNFGGHGRMSGKMSYGAEPAGGKAYDD
jgi:hypothetical protein